VPMALHSVPRLPHRAVAEVVCPSPHRAVQRARDFHPRRLVAGPQSPTNLVPNRSHGFLRGARTVIASASSRRVHGSEGVSEKVEGLTSSVAHPRLGLVQREPDAGHPSPSRVENLAGPVPTEDHEIVSVGHQHRAVPAVQTVLAKRLDEAMHIDVRHQWRNYSLNAKDNFQFERVIKSWRTRPLLDLRRK